MRLLEALGHEFLLGDGANGTCLADRGFVKQPYDFANLLAPELVRQVHSDYFDAGSDFVETNTFQANRLRMADRSVDVRAVNIAGARIARSAAGAGRLVLGAIGPSGKPVEPIGAITEQQVTESVQEQARALEEGGVDGFILESYVDMGELKIAVVAIKTVSQLPILVSKAYIEDGEMLAEGLPGRCTTTMSELGVVAVGANCIVGPQRMLDVVRQMAENTELPILAFPTPGLPQLVKGQIVYDATPGYFAKATARLREEGARILGGCCGTTPEHIRQLRAILSGSPVKVKVRPKIASETTERAPMAASDPSELSRKIGRKFITSVEMDVPRGLNIARLLSGAKALKVAGADVINISDGARARLRMNPATVSHLIQDGIGIEVTMHFSCRDRNLLAIQSDLLGCHALGIRNILAITGDPANIGDYPSATSVFDVDSIGLCRILSRFNEGIDLAGYSIGVRCAFTIACAYNPLALDAAVEVDRLKRKVDSGASLVYTQPVFDHCVASKAVETCGRLGVPVLIGVLPLRSVRHAEFMHNEVPGVEIPEWLLNTINKAPDDASALEIGIAEAQKLTREIRKIAQGIYLMPPFGNHLIAQRVMEATN